MFELLTQVLVKQPAQSISAHSPLAHLAADHKGTAAATRWALPQFPPQQAWICRHHPQHHPVAVMTATDAMQPVEAAVPPPVSYTHLTLPTKA